MSKIWERSRNKGSALLLLLAIADHAHDDGGGAYPSIPSLARKTRLCERNVQILLQRLVESGELEIQMGGGPHGVNLYRVKLAALGGAKIAPVQNLRLGGEKSGAEGVKALAPKSSCSEGTVMVNQQQQQRARDSNGAAAAQTEPHNSLHSLADVRRYCQATKRHATNPGGLARKLWRSGEEDTEIAEWLEAQARRERESAIRNPQSAIERPERSGAWGVALDAIESRIGKAATITWFEPLVFDPERGALIAPDPVFREWITNNYQEALDAGLERAGLGRLEITTTQA